MPDGTEFVELDCQREEIDGYGYARIRQTTSHALRHLSPLSAAAIVGISKCMA